jgi:hypothetical protein
MARCPDCNKFVSLDSSQDPEVTIDVDETGEVTCAFQIANACEQCGTEMFTAQFDTSVSADGITRSEDSKTLAEFLGECKAKVAEGETEDDEIDLEVDESDLERTDRYEGKGRGQRHYYGAKVGFTVKATFRGVTHEFEGSVEDEIQASSMDQQY